MSEKIRLTGKPIEGGKAWRMDIDGNIIEATIELSPPVLQNLKEGDEVLVKEVMKYKDGKLVPHIHISNPLIVAILPQDEEQKATEQAKYICPNCEIKLQEFVTSCANCGWDMRRRPEGWKEQSKEMPEVPDKWKLTQRSPDIEIKEDINQIIVCIKWLMDKAKEEQGR